MSSRYFSGQRPLIWISFLGGLALSQSPIAASEQRPYWICTDASGRKSAQDRVCENVPAALPAGTLAGPGSRAPVAQREESVDILSVDDVSNQLNELKQIGADVAGREYLISRAGLITACATLGAILAGGLGLRLLWPKLRQRCLERAAALRPGPFKKLNAQAAGRSGQVNQAHALRQGASTWSAPVLERLTLSQLVVLADRLFTIRNLVSEKLASDASVLLLKKSGPDKPRYGVVLCRANGSEQTHGQSLVRELVGLMSMHGLEYGALVAPGDFDAGARDSARGNNVELKGSQTLLAELEVLSDEARRQLLAEVLKH